MRSQSIAGWCALVTGASSGIGAATARALAQEGCNLVLVARRRERLEALRAEILASVSSPSPSCSSRSFPDLRIHTAVLDVRDAEAVSGLLDSLPAEFREVDILVNNAGLALGVDGVSDLSVEDVETMVATNCLALARLTRLCTPGMLARDRGHVVTMGSVAGSHHYGGGAAYCATKAFALAFTNSARSDLVDSQVRVTLISPGAVKTEFGGVRFKGDEAAADKVYEGIDALTAEDCADAVVFSVTRPANCQVGDITLWATRQATPQVYGRRK
jgi:NADP-dependent 3-hydroxy acid dehydrogenase YdfG